MLFPQVTYPIVVWGLYTGIAAAAIITTASRFRTGKTVRALISHGALSPENAMTAGELGLTGGAARALRGTLYGKLFVCANEAEASGRHSRKNPYDSPKPDMAVARFYLPKEKQYQAEERFPKPSVVSLVLGLVALTLLFTALHFFLPSIVSAVTSAFSR